MRSIRSFYLKYKNNIDFIAPFIYLFILILGTRYVRAVVKNPSFNITEEKKEEEPKKIEEKEIDIVLDIYDQDSKLLKNIKVSNYKNTKSVADFLSKLRRDGNIYYERVAYIDRIELINVNELPTSMGLKWAVFANGTDITNEIDDLTFIELDNIKLLQLRLISTGM